MTADFASELALTGSVDKTVRLWSPLCGHYDEDFGTDCPQQCFIMRGHTGAVRAVSASFGSGEALSASKDKSLRLWDLREKTRCSAPARERGRAFLNGTLRNAARSLEFLDDSDG